MRTPIPERSEVIAGEQAYLFQGTDLTDVSWSEAACQDAEPEVFFPISPRDVASRDEALSYCAACRIRSACLTLALRDKSLVGIWGGTDEVERERLRRGSRLAPVA